MWTGRAPAGRGGPYPIIQVRGVLLQDSQFLVNELSLVMTYDAAISSHPVVVPVSSPDEISEVFDIISYSKVR